MFLQVPPAIVEKVPVSYQGTGIVVGTDTIALDKAQLRAQLEVYGKFGVDIRSKVEETRKTTQSTGFFSRFKDKSELKQEHSTSIDLREVPGCSLVSAKQENGMTTVRVELTQFSINNFFQLYLQKVQNEATSAAASLKVEVVPTKRQKEVGEAKYEAYRQAISKAKQFGVSPSILRKHIETLFRVETLLKALHTLN